MATTFWPTLDTGAGDQSFMNMLDDDDTDADDDGDFSAARFKSRFNNLNKHLDQLQPTEASRSLTRSVCVSHPQAQDYAKCERCHEAVAKQEQVFALGKIWHSDCFRCFGCQAGLVGVPFYTRDGRAFDKACYLERFGERCSTCGEYVEGKNAVGMCWAQLRAQGCGSTAHTAAGNRSNGGAVYHPHCVTCTVCGCKVQKLHNRAWS